MNDTTVFILLLGAVGIGWTIWFAKKKINEHPELRESAPTAAGIWRNLLNFRNSIFLSRDKGEIDMDLSPREFMEWTAIWYIRSAIFLYAVLVLIGIGMRYEDMTLLDTSDIWLIKWGWWDWKVFLPFLYAAYTVASIRERVGPDEIGAKLVFGKPVQNVWAGIIFAPLLFCRVIITSKNLTVIQVGRIDPKRDTQGTALEELPSDMYSESATKIPIAEPLRVTFADRSTTNETWTQASKEQLDQYLGGENPRREELFARLTTDPVVVIGVKIYDLRRLVQRVGTDRKEWANMLAQQAKATLSEFAGQHTVAYTIAHMHEANKKLLLDLETQIADPNPESDEHKRVLMDAAANANWMEKSWGLNVEWVRIATLGLPRHVNEGMSQARAEAYQQDKERRKAEANAYKIELEGSATAKAIEFKGTADAKARQLLGEAEAAAIRAKVEASKGETGRMLAELEAIGTALSKANLVVAPADNLIGTFKAIAASMKESQRQEQRPSHDEPRRDRQQQDQQQH